MVDDRLKRAHSVFMHALERDGHEREAFIAGECEDDPSLREDVDRLLRAAEESSDFLETPAVGALSRESPASTSAATPPVPGFRIIRTLGAGGMATVFEAEQESPRRRVALKIMRHAFMGDSALERFRFETEILARLKHPGIAQIYEAGSYEDPSGQTLPYFTMELVDDARPLAAFADSAALSQQERLGLFADVCDAVRQGHQAGVVHRDLKPSNVLVDGEGRVKVIDFGIARSLGSVDARITLDADRGRLMGTLNYMSPEQCAGSEVDARSDVYSLGVMLYELLTGALPHDFTGTSIPEAARRIESESPARPGAVAPDVRGDLELIVLTAMEKDRARRYGSAAEFGADVRRLLSNQPIRARPATRLYQARKFAQRHRPLVIGAASVFVVLVAGVVATSRMAYLANQARRAAEQRERELEQVTEFQRSQLSDIDVAAMGAQLHEALVEGLPASHAADPQTLTALEAINYTSLALNLLDDNVLERSHLAIDERFADQPLLRAQLLQTLAGTMNTLGLPDRAEPALATALEIRIAELGREHPETLLSTHSMGSLLSTLARYDEALQLLTFVYETRSRSLGRESPDAMQTANTLGGVYRKMGRLDEAASIWNDTLEIRRRVLGDDHPDTLITLNNVGVSYAVAGNYDQAGDAWRELLERRRRVYGEDHPAYRNTLSNLGALAIEQGDLQEARRYIELSLESLLTALGDEHPSTLGTMSTLANLLVELDDPAAESVLRQCAEMRASVLGPEHPDTLRSRAMLLAFLTRKGESETALADLEATLSLQRDILGDVHPDTIESMKHVADGRLLLGDPEAALAMATEGIAHARALNASGHVPNSKMLYTLAAAHQALGHYAEAEATLLQAHAGLVESLGENHALTIEAQSRLDALHEAWREVEPSGQID